MTKKFALPLAAMLFVAFRCSAGTLTLTDFGTWGNDAAITTESAPNEPWTLSFQLATNPIPLNYTTNVQTVVPITNLIFTLNGVTVQNEPTGGSVELFTLEGFRLYFQNGDALQIQDGAQLYSGTEANPTVLPGTYPRSFANNAFLFSNSDPNQNGFYYFTTANPIVISGGATAAPEPSSLLLLGAGLVAFAGFAVRRAN